MQNHRTFCKGVCTLTSCAINSLHLKQNHADILASVQKTGNFHCNSKILSLKLNASQLGSKYDMSGFYKATFLHITKWASEGWRFILFYFLHTSLNLFLFVGLSQQCLPWVCRKNAALPWVRGLPAAKPSHLSANECLSAVFTEHATLLKQLIDHWHSSGLLYLSPPSPLITRLEIYKETQYSVLIFAISDTDFKIQCAVCIN